jgi:hypothetical protein
MSVFLRWGIFGILGVAGLLYAYNASKRLAEVHAGKAPTVAAEPASPPEVEVPADEPVADVAPAAPSVEPASAAPAHCEAELVVAQRALDMKRQGEPLDRVLRMQEIAWQETPLRRQRLEKVATRWYGYEGSFQPETLRIAVISDCQQAVPAP